MVEKLCDCGEKSVPGLKKGIALCHFHYDVQQFGEKRAKWVHGYARCASCGNPLDACQGIYRRTPMCYTCDEKTYTPIKIYTIGG